MTEEQRKDFEEAAEKYAFDSAARTVAKFAFLAGCEHAVPKWIDVKERLPDDDKLVLVYGDGMVKIVKRLKGSKGWHSRRLSTYFLFDAFTHWQPLPSSPPSSTGN
jgi:hypothetical protein